MVNGFNIDRNEIIWERIYGKDDRCYYLITSDKRRETYYLYEVADDGVSAKKIHKGRNPVQIWDKYLSKIPQIRKAYSICEF